MGADPHTDRRHRRIRSVPDMDPTTVRRAGPARELETIEPASSAATARLWSTAGFVSASRSLGGGAPEFCDESSGCCVESGVGDVVGDGSVDLCECAA